MRHERYGKKKKKKNNGPTSTNINGKINKKNIYIFLSITLQTFRTYFETKCVDNFSKKTLKILII